MQQRQLNKAKMKKPNKEIDRAANAALWYKQLCETNNETFIPLFFDEHRFLVLKGGGGSGKSIFAGRKILERVTSEPGHRILVCRKVDKTIRESCFEQLKAQALEFYSEHLERVPRGKSSDMHLKFKNGSEILFSGLDNVEKLKSIYNITGIWIEEASELEEKDFNQLDIRLRGETKYYKQIIITFNPISINHWLKKRFWDNADKRALTHESTYKDNRFLDEEAKKVLEAFKDIDEYYYMVYCLGMWGVTGKSIFNSKAINERLAKQIKPVKRGIFTYAYDGLQISDICFEDDRDGFVKVYKEPENGVPYVIGGDTAGDGSDFFVAQVIDNRTGEQVCTLRHKFDEDLFAHQIYCLGMYYNIALIGVEANYSTYPNMELERLGYPKLYVRESIDDYTHKVKHSYGFVTSQKTRPVIIAELKKEVRDSVENLFDETTMQEMLTFVHNESFRPEAEAGSHDDCVMALAIAYYIRPQQDYLKKTEKQTVTWTASMWEDYYSASEQEKKMLIKRWGQPAE